MMIFLFILIIACNLSSAMFGTKTISWGFLTGNGAILIDTIPYCIANFLIDIFTNQYGWQNSKKLIYYTLSCYILSAILFRIVTFTSILTYDTNAYLNDISLGMVSGAIAGSVAFTITCHVFSRMFVAFNGQQLWLRCLLATCSGEVVFNLISNIVYLYSSDSIINILILTLHMCIFNFEFELFTLPLTYFIIYMMNRESPQNTTIYVNCYLPTYEKA